MPNLVAESLMVQGRINWFSLRIGMFLATPLLGKNYLHKQSIAPCSRFDGMSERIKISLAAAGSIALLSVSAFLGLDSDIRSPVADDRSEATIEVDATRTL